MDHQTVSAVLRTTTASKAMNLYYAIRNEPPHSRPPYSRILPPALLNDPSTEELICLRKLSQSRSMQILGVKDNNTYKHVRQHRVHDPTKVEDFSPRSQTILFTSAVMGSKTDCPKSARLRWPSTTKILRRAISPTNTLREYTYEKVSVRDSIQSILVDSCGSVLA